MSTRTRLPFANNRQRETYSAMLAEFRALGYSGTLLEEDYRFGDWFASDIPERAVSAVAFGQLPLSYDTACLGIVLANGATGKSWIRQYRSLGAPYIFELRTDDQVVKWSVGAQDVREDMRFDCTSVADVFRKHANDWSRVEVLRAKNISTYSRRPQQLDMFLDTGLIPAIEQEIQRRLDPILRESLSLATEKYQKSTGKQPDPTSLFQLAFRLLAGKVFFDRGIQQLRELGESPGPDAVIDAVSTYYGDRQKSLLTKDAREAIYNRLWTQFDFRNLSIEVLTMIWSGTFVTPDVRKKLGIHPTRRTVARYVVERLPFQDVAEPDRIVVEPCAGSGTFLVAALNRLRDLLPPNMNEQSRHLYFRERLFGFEQEPFGVEIGKLCLTLADFPNPNGWHLTQANVFKSQGFIDSLKKARFVLCNPPFEDFDNEARRRVGARHHAQPAELLCRVLDNLHADGALGFVLPHTAIDGCAYKEIRQKIAHRFSEIEIVSLPPESAFETARHPTMLLICYGHKAKSRPCTVVHRKVDKKDWAQFVQSYRVSSEPTEQKNDTQVVDSLLVPDLLEVWKTLRHCDRLGKIAKVHRGIEWNKPLRKNGKETGNRDKLVKNKPAPGYQAGIPPLAKPFYAFSLPPTAFLSVHEEDHRRGFNLPWDKPKVFLNSSRNSLGKWRLAAVPDFTGLLCYQTFTAIWPHDPKLAIPLAAILNSPVANAFLATHDLRHNRNSSVENIPMPDLRSLDTVRVTALVKQYQEERDNTTKDMILRQIDALVLSAYGLSPKLERQLLDYFNGSRRQVPFQFADYFPGDFTPWFSLANYLSKQFRHANVGNFTKDCREAPAVFRNAIENAMHLYE